MVLSALLTPHSCDPEALVLRFRWLRLSADDIGRWAAKIASHEAHHRFGEFGRQRHVQLNLWRVGVKGSGISYRVPLLSPARVLLAIAQPFA